MHDTQRGNRLGPYQLGARYRSTGSLGRIYRAHNLETGAPALVLQRTERQAEDVPLADWQVRVTSSTAPAFLALEVESAPAPGHPSDVAEELVFMLGDAEQVANATLDRPETMPHLHAPRRAGPQIAKLRNFAIRPSPSGRRPSLAAGLAALAAAAVLYLGNAQPKAPLAHESGAELAHVDSDAGWGGEESVTGLVLTSTVDTGPIMLARALPKKPFTNQKRPPCEKPLEAEIHGGCWVPHEVRAPCPDRLYEFEGKCYLPAAKPDRAPTAVSR